MKPEDLCDKWEDGTWETGRSKKLGGGVNMEEEATGSMKMIWN